MKYTYNEGKIIEVRGCTTCPHMKQVESFMKCKAPTLQPSGEYRRRTKKLIGNWMGAYHSTCPLASSPDQVPVLEENK